MSGSDLLVAEKFGASAETVRKWVRQAEIDGGARPGVTSAVAQRIKELKGLFGVEPICRVLQFAPSGAAAARGGLGCRALQAERLMRADQRAAKPSTPVDSGRRLQLCSFS